MSAAPEIVTRAAQPYVAIRGHVVPWLPAPSER
jgi:hypothetical protein